MTESEWKELVETYSREAAEEFQKTVNAYNREKDCSTGKTRFCAECSWGNQNVQCWKNFRKKKEVAETEYLEKEKIYNQLRIDNKDDREIF